MSSGQDQRRPRGPRSPFPEETNPHTQEQGYTGPGLGCLGPTTVHSAKRL